MEMKEINGKEVIETTVKRDAILEAADYTCTRVTMKFIRAAHRLMNLREGDKLYIEKTTDSLNNYLTNHLNRESLDLALPAFVVYVNDPDGEVYLDSTPYLTEEQRDKAIWKLVSEIDSRESYLSI